MANAVIVVKQDVLSAFEKALIERAEEADVCGVLQHDARLMGEALTKRGFTVGEVSPVKVVVSMPGIIAAQVTVAAWAQAEHGDEPDFWVRSSIAIAWALHPVARTEVMHGEVSLECAVCVYQSENMWPAELAKFSYPRVDHAGKVTTTPDMTRFLAVCLTEQQEKLNDNRRIVELARLAQQTDEAIVP